MCFESSGCLSYNTELQNHSGLRACEPKALAGHANCACHVVWLEVKYLVPDTNFAFRISFSVVASH